MGSAQQYSLRWNNYAMHITSALDDLRTEDELTDVTLCAQGLKIRAHKLLLSACSSFFRETFRENPCEHPVIILKGVSFLDLTAVVQFMYNGQVNVSHDRLNTFLQAAEMLQIKGLTDMNDKQDGNNGASSSSVPPPTKKRTFIPNANKPINALENKTHLNSLDSVQRPPTPKRKKVLPLPPQQQQQQQGDAHSSNSNAGSAYNSPGPSSVPTVVENNNGTDSMGRGVGDVADNSNSMEGGEQYIHDPSLLKYENQDGAEGEDDYQDSYGMDDQDYEGPCSYSMQDLSGMEQGALDIGDCEEVEEAEAMILAPKIDEFQDENDDMPPILTPMVSCVAATTASEMVKIKPSSNVICTILPYPPPPPAPSSSSHHINILRKRRPVAEPIVDANPLEITSRDFQALRSSTSKNQSPFLGEAMMDQETGEIMHPCLMCDKKYKLKSSLESHVKIHEGSDNSCSICGQTMSRQRDLKRHVATVHRGVLMPDGSIAYPAQ